LALPYFNLLIAGKTQKYFLFNLAERIIVLVEGQKYLEGTPEEIRKDERLQKIYFGE